MGEVVAGLWMISLVELALWRGRGVEAEESVINCILLGFGTYFPLVT